MAAIRVAVAGATGQMGRLACGAVEGAADLRLVARLGRAEVAEPEPHLRGADVLVDFTNPSVTLPLTLSALSAGVHAVVGTSGWTAAMVNKARRAQAHAAANVLLVPNFAVGSVLLMRLAELVAPHFPAAEIIELHHDRKADAPSGTALRTAERIDAARAAAGRGPQTRRVESAETVVGVRGGRHGDTRVHAIRLDGLLAHQEVIFGGPGETLTLRHDSIDRASFMPGVLLAVRRIADLPGLTVGLDAVLGL